MKKAGFSHGETKNIGGKLAARRDLLSAFSASPELAGQVR
jgi:hypothetical protein